MNEIVQKEKKSPLKRLGTRELALRASKGMFRPCVKIGEVFYQIGMQCADIDTAFARCKEHMKSVQIFDDMGEEHILFGKLYPSEPTDETAGENWHQNECPPASWQTIVE